MTFLSLLWTVDGLCQNQRQMMWRLEQGRAMQSWHCGGSYFSRQSGTLIYSPLTFVGANSVLSYGLAERGKEKPFQPLHPVRGGRKRQRETRTLCPRCWQLLRLLNNRSEFVLRGHVRAEIVSEIWREEGACKHTRLSLWWRGCLDGGTTNKGLDFVPAAGSHL